MHQGCQHSATPSQKGVTFIPKAPQRGGTCKQPVLIGYFAGKPPADNRAFKMKPKDLNLLIDTFYKHPFRG